MQGKFRQAFRALGDDAARGLLDAIDQNAERGTFVDDCLVSQGVPIPPLLIEKLDSGSNAAQLWAANAAWEIAARNADGGVRTVADARLDAREPLRSRLLRVLDLTGDFGRRILLEAQGSGDPRMRKAALAALDALTGTGR